MSCCGECNKKLIVAINIRKYYYFNYLQNTILFTEQNMKKINLLFATIMISLTLSFAGISDVEAKRFGGARSFGGKSSYSSPYRRSTTSKPQRSASQQKAYQKNQSARQSLGRRGGLMGMLGGLALGGLLGSLFFGGAFEGFNFMDILIFGGIAYLLYRIFAAKAGPSRHPSYSGNTYSSRNNNSTTSHSQHKPQNFTTTSKRNSANFDTDILFKKNKQQSYSSATQFDNDADFEEDIIPTGFDEADFLKGAKGAFHDLQKAWDNHDLAEIRGLTTDKVFAEIQDQIQASTEKNQTDVSRLDAELISIRETNNMQEAVVLFDMEIKENADLQYYQVKEIWHFIKSKNSVQPKWYLDGIQQLEQ